MMGVKSKSRDAREENNVESIEGPSVQAWLSALAFRVLVVEKEWKTEALRLVQNCVSLPLLQSVFHRLLYNQAALYSCSSCPVVVVIGIAAALTPIAIKID